jgi:hypothetical protein
VAVSVYARVPVVCQNGDGAAGLCLVGIWSELAVWCLLSIFSPFIPFGPSNLVSIPNPTPFEPASFVSAGGSHSSARRSSPSTTHPCASRVFSVRRTSGETQTLEVSVRPPADAFQSAAGHFAAVNGPACRI